ncbi:septin-1 isoform X2 [Rhinolophus ferrumequinum]|nr:septin-1 isoform X2 [Rhinolophus ferrumequinum]XP_032957333.1 septin-1 isoform X2 [Rhinolophus ferrumequinum]XP_032957334.1 septin-1 isoform X2 [Rhinolophus ferrumequinum]XP_032957335.1 septin-1 isoform X2 [Rhinolophus ferrumequinum]
MWTMEGPVKDAEKISQKRKSPLKDEEDKEYVGFAALPNQLHRKSVKKGFDFTLMVAGESGLGKSTLVNSLFLTNLYADRQLPEASARLTQTLTIERRGVEIEEGGIKVKLTLVDTPGFGDSVDCSDCWLPVVRFIEEQFEQYLRDESGLNRKNIQDSRVHCCLYFISPFGRGLRPLDVAFLRAVHEKVNIIPVIGKADALMPKETQALKQKIRDQLKEEEINIYQFPDCDSDEDEDFKRQDAEMKESIPFAVVGSCEVVRDGGTRPVRGRHYSWGTVEVENPHHCDFLNLRRMLVQTHLQDLKEVTHDLLYEGYRARCLQSLARPGARDRASRSKLSRQSATEIPLPMLPLADTEKLIREKDEEVSKRLASPHQGPQSPLKSLPGLARPHRRNHAPHSCAACKRCWRRCRRKCSRARLRASSRTRSEALAGALLHLGPAYGPSPVQSRNPRLPSAESRSSSR